MPPWLRACFILQGKTRGFLSPYLSAVYLDELLAQLGTARAGCAVGSMVVNNPLCWYMCLFFPTSVLFNAFWIIVVDMLLNMTLFLFATKELVQFPPLKRLNILPHQLQHWIAQVLSMSAKSNMSACYSMLHCKVITTCRGKWNDFIMQQTRSWVPSLSGLLELKTLFSVWLHVNVCLLVVYTESSIKCLRVACNSTYRVIVRQHQITCIVWDIDCLDYKLFLWFC